MSLENAKTIQYPNYQFKQDYKIDKEGNIYSPWRGWHKMSQHTNKAGYKELYLYTTESRKCFKVHRLIMTTFCPIDKDISNLQINHIDGNKANNNINNLEWCTRSENLLHAFKTGLEKRPIGEKNPSHKLSEKEVKLICEELQNGKISQEIANRYNVSKGCISHIKNRRTWKEISKDYIF